MAAAKIEYKCTEDDAWYDVSLKIVRNRLKVRYDGFAEDHDELLSMEKFKTNIETSRFRFSSNQLQDQQCRRVRQEMNVCVSKTSDIDLKFFDAVVKEVIRSEHVLVDSEERCTCKFKVQWKDGPNAGEVTTVSCEDMCFLSPGCISSHPVIKAFTKMVEKKLCCKLRYSPTTYSRRLSGNEDKQAESGMKAVGGGVTESKRPCNGVNTSSFGILIDTPVKHIKLEPLDCSTDLQSLANPSSEGVNTLNSGILTKHMKHDIIQGTMKHLGCSTDLQASNILVLDNIEKDVNPFDVKKVLSSTGCRVSNVYILPSREFQQFTRGLVFFQDRASLMKAHSLLEDDNFFIVSSTGRPWVVLHIDDAEFEGSFEELRLKLEDVNHCCGETASSLSSSRQILFVHKGTKEHENSREEKNSFLKFRENLAALHTRMSLMEKEIMES